MIFLLQSQRFPLFFFLVSLTSLLLMGFCFLFRPLYLLKFVYYRVFFFLFRFQCVNIKFRFRLIRIYYFLLIFFVIIHISAFLWSCRFYSFILLLILYKAFLACLFLYASSSFTIYLFSFFLFVASCIRVSNIWIAILFNYSPSHAYFRQSGQVRLCVGRRVFVSSSVSEAQNYLHNFMNLAERYNRAGLVFDCLWLVTC